MIIKAVYQNLQLSLAWLQLQRQTASEWILKLQQVFWKSSFAKLWALKYEIMNATFCYFLFCFVSGNLFSSFSEQNRMQSCTKEQQLLILKQIAKCCVHHLCSAIFVWWTCKVEFGSFSTFVEAKLNREKWSWCWLPVGGPTPSSELLALPAARNFLECENI